ncbi:MAG: hypothetical protein H6Q08_2909 [Acidobacteria bacterium]|jgi:bacteriocin-like protein|nr:hypothetical protein [Acidobacteriota bacterium]
MAKQNTGKSKNAGIAKTKELSEKDLEKVSGGTMKKKVAPIKRGIRVY